MEVFYTPDAFLEARGSFDIAYLGFGGSSGFLTAMTARERDRDCRMILVDDTGEFALRGLRLHCTDFIVRPMTFQHVARSMRLATMGELR